VESGGHTFGKLIGGDPFELVAKKLESVGYRVTLFATSYI